MTDDRPGLLADKKTASAGSLRGADPRDRGSNERGDGGAPSPVRSMHGHPIGRYPVPRLDELPEDMRARIVEVNDKLGFVPNVFWTLAHRPDEFRAFFAYFDALMLQDSGVTKAEREMIVVATGALNHSVYCVAHHGAILRLRARNSTIADQIAINYRRADLSPRERAMLDFAVKVATDSHALEDVDFERLVAHGFSEEDIWDIGAITAFFSYGSRMANLITMRPNDEFYALGRGKG